MPKKANFPYQHPAVSHQVISDENCASPPRHIRRIVPLHGDRYGAATIHHAGETAGSIGSSPVLATGSGRVMTPGRCLKIIAEAFLPIVDCIVAPFVYPAAFLMKFIRMAGVQRMPLCKTVFTQVGVFPIRNHYFEPLFDCRALKRPLQETRDLLGIDWNVAGQLALLDSFRFNDELAGIPDAKTGEREFHFNNVAFESGDAEFLYNLIRLRKPARVFEIGSGHSTLMAMKAIERNKKDGCRCRHLCIEPYERPWLEEIGVEVVRQRVEDVDRRIFSELEKDDILFIDSSHVIRPQGDVLFEYLQLLPALKSGVIVHIHDIFSPRDYPEEWVRDEVRLWNEQYLLEAFLTCNREWKILGALNYLHHDHYERLRAKCPYLTRDREPGSFYIQKVA